MNITKIVFALFICLLTPALAIAQDGDDETSAKEKIRSRMTNSPTSPKTVMRSRMHQIRTPVISTDRPTEWINLRSVVSTSRV